MRPKPKRMCLFLRRQRCHPLFKRKSTVRRGVPVPAPPEVPPVLQEQKESEKEVPAPPIGQEQIEEVGVGPKKQEMVAIKEEDKKEAVPEEEAVGAMEKTLPQVKEGAMEEEGK